MKQLLEMLRQLRVGLSLDIYDAYSLHESNDHPEICMTLQNTADIARKGHRVDAGERLQCFRTEGAEDGIIKISVSRNARLVDYNETRHDGIFGGPLNLIFVTDFGREETRTFRRVSPNEPMPADCYFIGFLLNGQVLIEVRQ